MHIARGALSQPEAQALIAELDAELSERYPEEGATHFGLTDEDVAPGRGVFLILTDDRGTPLGCGALRRLDAERAEVKRMYVVPRARGQKLAQQVLDALEAEARALGVARVVLETGVRQGEAIRLYERSGYVGTAPWGEYVDSPLSVCLEKRLV